LGDNSDSCARQEYETKKTQVRDGDFHRGETEKKKKAERKYSSSYFNEFQKVMKYIE